MAFNNVPMEIVSELLGHTKLATTQQSYCKIVQRKVGDEEDKGGKIIKPSCIYMAGLSSVN